MCCSKPLEFSGTLANPTSLFRHGERCCFSSQSTLSHSLTLDEFKALRSVVRKVLKEQETRQILLKLDIPRNQIRKAIVSFPAMKYLDELPNDVKFGLLRRQEAQFEDAVSSLIHSHFIPFLLQKTDYAETDVLISDHPILSESNLDHEMVLREVLDMRLPHEYFPSARKMKRKVILHRGPTNSGKTYHALKRLKSSKNGLYCGPLRMLAWEVYEKLSDDGIACSLITGQEQLIPENATHTACTVEMTNFNQFYECAVIDEIQMISSQDRGSAFTNALLGIAAKELHLCGDMSSLSIIEELCSITGDELVVEEYKRLGTLQVQKPISSLSRIQKGDCIVTFSRRHIYEIKASIERKTGMKACVIYGDLPPDIRKDQANLFNDEGSGYDVLISSDAIGLGLNLAIKRIIFATMSKYDGVRERNLSVSEVLQIGGRAGRYSAGLSVGYVSCADPAEFPLLQGSLESTPPIITKAGLSPPPEVLSTLHTKFPNLPFSRIIELSSAYATLDGTYFMCDMSNVIKIATRIDSFDISPEDRYTICMSPADVRNPVLAKIFDDYISLYSEGKEVPILIQTESSIVSGDKKLMNLETLHKILDLYIWLSFRFPTQFTNRIEAQEKSNALSYTIQKSLERIADENLENYGMMLHRSRKRRP